MVQQRIGQGTTCDNTLCEDLPKAHDTNASGPGNLAAVRLATIEARRLSVNQERAELEKTFASEVTCAMTNPTIEAFLLLYAGLFPIVNPVAIAPIFLGITQASTGEERHKLAAWVAINGFLLLAGSVLVGSYVLEFFGITMPVLRVGGGLVVVAIGWKLLNEAGASVEYRTGSEGQASGSSASFYPLTMPLTIGPGAIATAITLGSERPEASGIAEFALSAAGAAAGIIAIAITIYFCFRFADRIVAALGTGGTNVLIRLSAFILFCIGIQIVWSGCRALISHP